MADAPLTIACCPYCQGRNGFITDVVIKAKRMYSFDGRDTDTEDYSMASETNARCADCGKALRAQFRLATTHKDAP